MRESGAVRHEKQQPDFLGQGKTDMGTIRYGIAAAAIAAAMSLGMASMASAACVNKGGEGTNTTADGAKFQAWEAVLQATDWGSWVQFMAGGQKIGTAPGYKVSKVRMSCKAGGLGQTCRAFATLCK
jgi:hypothetical protein